MLSCHIHVLLSFVASSYVYTDKLYIAKKTPFVIYSNWYKYRDYSLYYTVTILNTSVRHCTTPQRHHTIQYIYDTILNTMLPYVCYTVWDTTVLCYYLTSRYYAILYLYITLSHYTFTVPNLNSSCCHDTPRHDTFHGCTIHLQYITSHCYTYHQHTLPLLHSTKRYVTSHCICVTA